MSIRRRGRLIRRTSPYSVGNFVDKPWIWVDTHPTSPCRGTLYHASTRKTGFDDEPGAPSSCSRARPTEGGRSPSRTRCPRRATTASARAPTSAGAGRPRLCLLAVEPDPAWQRGPADPGGALRRLRPAVRQARHRRPVQPDAEQQRGNGPGRRNADAFLDRRGRRRRGHRLCRVPRAGGAPGFPSVPHDADVFVARSVDGGQSWEAPVRVNDDATGRHQFFPTVAVSGGVLHVAWYDLRHSLGLGMRVSRGSPWRTPEPMSSTPRRFPGRTRSPSATTCG